MSDKLSTFMEMNEKRLLIGWNNNMLLLFSGILLVLAFPPLKFGFLAYFALIPFFIVLKKQGGNFRAGFLSGFKLGLIFHLGTIHWIAFNTGTDWYWAVLSMIGAIIWASLFFGFFGIVITLINREIGNLSYWFAPLLFTFIEFIRGYGLLAFTWPSLAHTQVYSLFILQTAASTGLYGLTFWIVLLNTMLFYIFYLQIPDELRIRMIITTVFIFLIIPFSGYLRLKSSDTNITGEVSVGCVQPNVDPREKWVRMNLQQNIDVLYTLSDSILQDSSVRFIVWPETAIPVYLRNNYQGQLDKIMNYVEQKKISLFTGVPDYEGRLGSRKYYNAAYFFSPGMKHYQIYRKQKLVPFGEYIPFSGVFPELNHLNLGQGNFSAGEGMKTFDILSAKNGERLRFCGVICYESVFPYIIREGVLRGARLLAIITNDAWFGKSLGPYQHAAFARFRAVENGISVVRSANTGISEIIDPYGRIIIAAPFGKQAILAAKVPIISEETVYTRWGEWFPKLIGIIIFVFFNYLLVRRQYVRSKKN